MWFYRPRIDPGFVGTWTWYAADHGLPASLEDAERVAKLIFNDDGSGRAVALTDSEELARLVWHVNGRGRFVLELSLTPSERFKALTDRLRGAISGVSPVANEDVWQIRERSAERIVLQNIGNPDYHMILQRWPSGDSAR